MGILIAYLLGIVSAIKNQPHGKPHRATSAQENPPSQVSPIIVSYTPPALTDEEIAEKNERGRREKAKFRFEKWGLFVLAIYTAFTGFIAWETKEATKAATEASRQATRSADIQQSVYEAANRPYVGLSSTNSMRDEKRKELELKFAIKNFGTVPAKNFLAGWRVTINGIESGKFIIKQGPGWLFPGEEVYLHSLAWGHDFQSIVSGKSVFAAEVVVVYDGPNGSYSYCSKQTYIPILDQFIKESNEGCTLKVK